MAEELKKFTYVSDEKLLYYTQQLKAKLSDLMEDLVAGVIDDEQTTESNLWSAKKIQDMLDGITQIKLQPVDVLPTTGKDGVIYLVPNDGEKPNIKDEYIWFETDELTFAVTSDTVGATVSVDPDVAKLKVTDAGTVDFVYDGSDWLDGEGNAATLADYGITFSDDAGTLTTGDKIELTASPAGSFEKIGSTDIDLTGYIKEEQLIEITEEQIDNIFATVWPDEETTEPATPPAGDGE